ncbi:MAG TPA: outer membrane beta-barrel protein [Candidatus Polarisedimenticolia bacterium]
MKTPILPVLLVALAPATALADPASTSAPALSDFAVTANIGFARAFDNDFDDFEPLFGVAAEFFVKPRLAVRAMAAFTSFDARINGFRGEADVLLATAGIVYNWEPGPVRPFISGGAGIYDKRFSGPAVQGADDGIEVGFNAGGGLDIPFESHWAIRIEGLLHGVTGDDPNSFFALTGGARYRF